jgi:hypothetical protein
VLNVAPQRYRYWSTTGILDPAPHGLSLVQAVELAVLVALLKAGISLQALRSSWTEVIRELRAKLPADDCYLIWDHNRQHGRIIIGSSGVGRVVAGISRAQVVSLDPSIKAAQNAFRKGSP